MKFSKALFNIDAWLFTFSVIITSYLILFKLQQINNILFTRIDDFFLLLLTLFLFIATLSLLSFTYQKLFKTRIEPFDSHLPEIGIFKLRKKSKNLKLKLNNLNLDELNKSDVKKIETETKELEEKIPLYLSKLILRSGEYLFLSALLLTFSFIFLGVDVLLDFFFRPVISSTEIVLFLITWSFFIFIRGLFNIVIQLFLSIFEIIDV